jgi:hypothetical protein
MSRSVKQVQRTIAKIIVCWKLAYLGGIRLREAYLSQITSSLLISAQSMCSVQGLAYS